MTYRPKIGLTMRLELESRRFYLGRDYSEAVAAMGATPVHIPLIPERAYLKDVIASLDGVLLPGSDTDVDPSYYGEEPHPRIGKTIPEKDETDLIVLEEAERRGIPVLAICFGMQVLNVSRGGSLIQDILSQVENCVKHQQGVPLARNSHSITVEDKCFLTPHVGDGSEGIVKVNSHHHQAIAKTGRHLRVVARASDGVVEAIEDTRTDRFVVGVQWHPELSWNVDGLSRGIFVDFVNACRNPSNRGLVPENVSERETSVKVNTQIIG